MEISLTESEKQPEPIKVTLPASTEPASRYGLCGIGGYLDHDGMYYPCRFTGGDISFSGPDGLVSVYRAPIVEWASKEFSDWVNENVLPSIEKFAGSLADIATINGVLTKDGIVAEDSDLYWDRKVRLLFKSKYALTKWFTLNNWVTVVRDIYNSFPKKIIRVPKGVKDEQFYVNTFADTKGVATPIPANFTLADGGEILIKPPVVAQAGITRIHVNQAVWMGMCRIFGFNTPIAIQLWEQFDTLYSSEKTVTEANFIDLLSRDGHNPVEGSYMAVESLATAMKTMTGKAGLDAGSISQIVLIIVSCVMRAILLKLFETTRQSISMQDWKFETPWTVYYRNMADEQFKKQLDTLHGRWAQTQVRVPTGTLSPRLTRYVLPITTHEMLGYVVHDTKRQHDNYNLVGRPALGMNRLLFHLSYLDGLLAGITGDLDKWVTGEVEHGGFQGDVTFAWVDLPTLNAAENEDMLVFNRVMGDVDSVRAADDVDCNVRIGAAFPFSLKIVKPVEQGVKLEPRHWPIYYELAITVSPIVKVATWRECELYNQMSLFGPKFYLVRNFYPKDLARVGLGAGQLGNLFGSELDAFTMSLGESVVKAFESKGQQVAID
jgi:hypothetical protein